MKISGNSNKKPVTDLTYQLEQNEDLYDKVHNIFKTFIDNKEATGFGVVKNITELASVLQAIRKEGIMGAYRCAQLELDKNKNDGDAELMRKVADALRNSSPEVKKTAKSNTNGGMDELGKVIAKKMNSGEINLGKNDLKSIENYKNGRQREIEEQDMEG